MTEGKPNTTIHFDLKITMWKNQRYNLTQFIVEETPRALYEFIPLPEVRITLNGNLYHKEVEFKFNKKRIVLTFDRHKEQGEP